MKVKSFIIMVVMLIVGIAFTSCVGLEEVPSYRTCYYVDPVYNHPGSQPPLRWVPRYSGPRQTIIVVKDKHRHFGHGYRR